MSNTTLPTTFKTICIDGDVIAYRYAAALEKPVNWEGDLWTLHSNANEVIKEIEDSLDFYADKFKADNVIVALTDSVNFRKELNPLYKSNRKSRKPITLKVVREYLTANWDAVMLPRIEGDDVMGIVASEFSNPEEVLLISVDKDFNSVPSYFYSMGKDTLVHITPRLADYYHMLQTLTGDTSDGYAGCPGCGPKTAEKLLGLPREINVNEVWPIVVQAYEKQGQSMEQALLMARMAYILRGKDYNKETNKVKLWTPNSL